MEILAGIVTAILAVCAILLALIISILSYLAPALLALAIGYVVYKIVLKWIGS